MATHNLCAFVANGSILPRENGTDAPMLGAIPFVSPAELRFYEEIRPIEIYNCLNRMRGVQFTVG